MIRDNPSRCGPYLLDPRMRGNDNGRFVSDAAVVRFDDECEETLNLSQESYRWLTDREKHLPKVGLTVEVLNHGTREWKKGLVSCVLGDEGAFVFECPAKQKSFTARLGECVWRGKEQV